MEPDIEGQGRILSSLGGGEGDTGVDREYQPICFGPTYLGKRVATSISA